MQVEGVTPASADADGSDQSARARRQVPGGAEGSTITAMVAGGKEFARPARTPCRQDSILNGSHGDSAWRIATEDIVGQGILSQVNYAQDTIVAISTPTGPGAIGIVRMSGPDSLGIAGKAFRPARGQSLQPAENFCLLYGHVFDPDTGDDVDEVLLAVMRAPRSYTREDVVELHCHGGLAAQRAVLRLLTRLGARPAEPGEFTRRAFLNGRIDLAQAESVAAIVAARSSGALRAWVRQLEGGLSGRVRGIRRELLSVLAQVEATVDFSEEDVEPIDWQAAARVLANVKQELTVLLRTALVGRALESGVRTAIVGKPNVGKSSLLNALLMRERAIVSEIPGTTRDTVEELLEIGGMPICLVDTAGIRVSGDRVEQLGIERSIRAMQQADLVLAVFDLSAQLEEEDYSLLAQLDPDRSILVANKVDLLIDASASVARLLEAASEPRGPARELRGPGGEVRETAAGEKGLAYRDLVRYEPAGLGGEITLEKPALTGWRLCAVSALNGEGLEHLRALVQEVVTAGMGVHLEEPVLASERQRVLAKEAAEGVAAALSGIEAMWGEELICEDLRGAVRALGRITGEDLTPDLLDEIFSRFCIGK